jgi:hypothetical protein
MTEAFDSMTTARLQMSQQQQHLLSNGNTYPQVSLHPSPQPQQVAAYYHNSNSNNNNNNFAELPPSLNYGLPSPPLSTGYSDSKYSQPAPANAYPYRPPQQNAVEMPVELPDHTPSAPASITAASTGVSSLQSLIQCQTLTKYRRRSVSYRGCSDLRATIALMFHYLRIHNTHDTHLTYQPSSLHGSQHRTTADRTLTALQNGSSWRTLGLIGSYQIIKNRSEIATMLIGYFVFLLLFRIEYSEISVRSSW